MKFMTRFAACVATLFIAATVAVQAQDSQQGKANVRSIKNGTAKYKDTSSGVTEWAKLKVGMELHEGALIETDAAGTVDLFLGVNGPVVRVTPSTQLGLTKLSFVNAGAGAVIDTELDLRSGTVAGHVTKLAAASKYQVKTPSGVCGIRGTDYVINANGSVTVLNGTVQVTYTNPANNTSVTVDVPAGSTFTPPTATTPAGVAPTPPGVVIDANKIISGISNIPAEGGPIIVTPVPDTSNTHNDNTSPTQPQ
jgi:hypothetical protein